MTNNGIAMTKNRTSWLPTNRTTFAVVSMTVITRASINLITNPDPVTHATTSVMAVLPITVIAMVMIIAMMTSMYSNQILGCSFQP
jgi:hypothetical protein